jgi:uncharacterized protein DUF6455
MGAIGKFGFPLPLRSTLGDFSAWGRKVLTGLRLHLGPAAIATDSDAFASESDSVFPINAEASLRLTVMMRRIGLIRDAIRDLRVLREIELNCASCDDTSDCRHWLQSKKTTGYHRFCLNAWRFDRLLAARR